MAGRERFRNNASSTLNGSITSGATTLTVVSASSFPTLANFRIRINDELLLVTNVSSNTFTVTRGVEGTSAAAHDDGDSVVHIVTADGLEEFWNTRISARPDQTPLPKILDSSGNVLDSSDFAWINQGTATVTDESDGSITISAPDNANSNNFRMQDRDAPATPWTLKAFIQMGIGGLNAVNGCFWGIYVRDSVTGQIVTCHNRPNSNAAVADWDNPTTFNNTNVAPDGDYDRMWFRIDDDGTNLTFYISMDGETWQELLSESRTAFLTNGPDKIGWFVEARNTNNGDNFEAHLIAWEES